MRKFIISIVILISVLFLTNCKKESGRYDYLTDSKWQNYWDYNNEIWDFKENGTLIITNRPTLASFTHFPPPYCNPCNEELLWKQDNQKIIITENYWGQDWDTIQGWHSSYITNKYEYDLIELSREKLEIRIVLDDVIDGAVFKRYE
jgi:nuclear transport factor 2 (NTF2) superfamily protein